MSLKGRQIPSERGSRGVYRCGSCGDVFVAVTPDGSPSSHCRGGEVREVTRDDTSVESADPDHKEVFETVFGVNERALEIYLEISESGPVTTKEVAEGVDLDRSAVSRHMKNLLETGMVERTSRNLRSGGCVYVYSPVPREELRENLAIASHLWVSAAMEGMGLGGAEGDGRAGSAAETGVWRDP